MSNHHVSTILFVSDPCFRRLIRHPILCLSTISSAATTLLTIMTTRVHVHDDAKTRNLHNTRNGFLPQSPQPSAHQPMENRQYHTKTCAQCLPTSLDINPQTLSRRDSHDRPSMTNGFTVQRSLAHTQRSATEVSVCLTISNHNQLLLLVFGYFGGAFCVCDVHSAASRLAHGVPLL